MLQVDCDVKPEDIQILRNPDAIVGFFAKRGYDTNKRVVQNPQHLGISNQTLLDQIKRVERIAENGSLRVYLIELSSVTVANTLQLSRSFKEMSGFFILVLTSDYERIDFVFLDRVIPIGKKLEVTTKPRFALRPRSLTVNRSNLDTVSKKVLRRLTFTESDEFAQYEKIRSAYTMADWTEDFFNNRALFSDYFLIHRLKENPVWREKAESSYLAFKNKLKPFSSQWHNVEEEEFFSNFIEPVLAELGFKFERVHRTAADEVKSHYILLSKSDKKKIGAMLSYRWGRHLDAKDYTRDNQNPEENPSQAVVTVLEEEEVPWVIVTNGKVWRLYSAKTHSRATNYYEIDLEETIAIDDPSEAFRYYWLLFREDAFIPRSYDIEGEERKMSFLDKLLYDSQEYSKELEKELKKRVFEEVFPFFAEGFIQTIGGKEKLLGLSEDERDAICRDVFSATLTILYRLLFLLYAESRDLLPGKEVRGYYDKSLTRLKKEIAGKAGNIADNVESKLKSSYTKSNTVLYDRLKELAEIIDKGKSSLNVPTYNGGLFLTEPMDDDTEEAEIARSLTRYKIPDYYLAIGLDKLARVEDKKNFVVPIDYKSLGVRQLGSIYEGILEFNVRIAPEKMAVVKGKKTEQFVPYEEAVEKELKIVTNGSGSEKREYILLRGSVYIENDKKERKATGAYYTPDYIVKYIVENTVGPVLEEKFKEITPKLRKLRPEQVETEGAKEIIDDLFDIHVLDPAMGSGHFLVETVDYITDKMLDFLNGFPNNPIQLELQRTRDAILDEMNRQGVSIDQNKVIDVSLMKRYVLKRCVYGVDLNPMAVELAKVSLWLDCFTLGAPLSFLNHHLKCGNSLIGANLKETEKEIETGQMTIWATSKFGGVKRASEHMMQVGELSDITTNMIEESKKEYCKATREIEPYKRLLDIYVSRWFSNSPIVTGKGKKKIEYDYTLDFLRSDEISEWLKDTSETKNLDNDQQQIIKNALTDAAIKRFFHWELEFPEIFCERKEEERGFDVVIGNPPYGINFHINEKEYIAENLHSFIRNNDLYAAFSERCIFLLRDDGLASMIIPNTFIMGPYFNRLKEFWLGSCHVVSIDDFGYSSLFPDPNVFSAIFLCRKKKVGTKEKTILKKALINNEVVDYSEISSELLTDLPIERWVPFTKLSNKAFAVGNRIEELCFVKDVGFNSWTKGRGKTRGGDSIGHRVLYDGEQKDSRDLPFLKGRDFFRYESALKINHWLKHNYESLLDPKIDVFRFSPEFLKVPQKIVYRQTSDHIIATMEPKRLYVDKTVHVIVFRKGVNNYSYEYILALLNSKMIDYVYKDLAREEGRTFAQVKTFRVNKIPVRMIFFQTTPDERKSIGETLQAYYHKNDFQNIIKIVDKLVPKDIYGNLIAFQNFGKWGYDKNGKIGKGICPEKSDVVHDFLVFLCERMIEMNTDKQTKVRRFFDWLESRFRLDLNELSGKTALLEYYKHEVEDFYSVLKKNKNHFYNIRDENVKRELLTEFKKSMETIEPLLDKIKSTDDLIDQIVYRLYGLTDEEIKIVEKSVGGRL